MNSTFNTMNFQSNSLRIYFLLPLILFLSAAAIAQHPRLIITREEITAIKEQLGKSPLFDRTYREAKEKVDKALHRPIDVPVPKDAGGYTHERHKQNYTEMHLAGILYCITGEEKYMRFIREMLLAYAELYPTLKDHPMASGQSAGRIFWQTLNETVWLVHTSQAYDCVYDRLSPKEREKIESGIFRPMAKFFIEDHVKEFDRIHNHGTWTVTAVGMLGYVLHDKEMVEKALYGTKKNGTGGFLRQLDLLFSPDGYYLEGPYYVRYAMMPFFLFAQAIENNQPEFKIFEYRDRILQKAFYSALQLTAPNGAFIPFNDALKEKNYLSPEVVIGLDIVYQRYGNDASLLGIAKKQDAVMLSGAGMDVSRGLAKAPLMPEFPYRSLEFTDGPKGDEGGVGILRSGPLADQSLVLMKYSSHGKEHGHYDRLSFLYYDQSREIIQDYGSVRFINVEPKFGGRYLPENKTYALQTIAHNTVTIDGQSQFQGKIEMAERHHPERYFFSTGDSMFQVMSAMENNAYPGVKMLRTVALVRDPRIGKPVILDLFRIVSDEQHTYDLPFCYLGHFLATNANYTPFTKQRVPLGSANGYQFLWKEAEGRASGSVRFEWMTGERYYTLISACDTTTEIIWTRLGANDPNFNLRNEPAVMLRQKAKSHLFASVIEAHGKWDGVKEFSEGAVSTIQSVGVLASTDEGSVVEVRGKDSLRWIFLVANGTASETATHAITAGGIEYRWTGNAALQR
jgi:hypothetical protein